jgi:hypothetical protein
MNTPQLRVLMLSAVAVAMTGCDPEATACTTNAQCSTGQVCTAGKCQAGSTGGGAATGGGTTTDGGQDGGVIDAGLCNSAPSVDAGLLTGQTIADAGNDFTAGEGCALGSGGNERAYRVAVPAGQRLTATVTPDVVALADGGTDVTFDPSLNIVTTEACAAELSCVIGANEDGADTVIFDNTGSTVQNAFVVVDTGTTTILGLGTFSLNISLTARTFLPGEVCANTAPVITASTTLAAQSLTGYANNYAPNGQAICKYGSGPDRAYAIDIAAGQVLYARAVPTPGGLADGGAQDIALSLLDATAACGTGPCVSGTDSPEGAEESVTEPNTSAATRRVNLVVDSQEAAPAGSFAVEVSLGAPRVGDTCANVGAAITTDTLLSAQPLGGYVNDFSSATPAPTCSFFSGPDRVYAVTIPARSKLKVTASSPTADLTINIIDGDASACVVSPIVCTNTIDIRGAGGTESTRFFNPGASAKTVLVVIDRLGGSLSPDQFDLRSRCRRSQPPRSSGVKAARCPPSSATTRPSCRPPLA